MTLQLYLKLFGMSYCYIIHNVLLSNVAVTVVRNLVSLYSWKWTVSVYSSADNGASGAAFQLGKAEKQADLATKPKRERTRGSREQQARSYFWSWTSATEMSRQVPQGVHPTPNMPICHFLSWLSSLCLSSPTFDLAWFIMISNGPFFFLCCSSATCAPECLL